MNPTDTTVDQAMLAEDTDIFSIVTSVICKNKKKNKLTIAKLYDNMLSTSYTLDNGELDKEKIVNQSYSFTPPRENM
jgi:hypothetical protein